MVAVTNTVLFYERVLYMAPIIRCLTASLTHNLNYLFISLPVRLSSIFVKYEHPHFKDSMYT